MATTVKAIRIDVDASAIEEAQVAFGGVNEEVQELNKQLAKLDAEKANATDPAEVARLDKEYKKLSKDLDKVAKEYKDVAKAEDEAKNSSEELVQSQQETAESAFKVGEGLVGAFTLVSLASSESQEETEALLADILQLIVVLDSDKKVSEGLTNGFKLAQKAAKGFGVGTKRAIAATGIGLLVVALGSLVVLFSEIEEEGGGAFDGLGDAIKKIKAGFNTFKDVVINNFKLVGLALAPVLVPIIAVVRTIQNIKKAFDEGKTGLDAFATGFKTTFEEAKVVVGELIEDVKGIGDKFKENLAIEELKDFVKALEGQVKLTNGLADANDKLSNAIIATTKNEKTAQKERDKIFNRRVSAINQELFLLSKQDQLNGKLTEDQLIRQRNLINDLKILRLNRTKFLEEQDEKEFQNRLKAIEDERKLRESALRASISDADLLNKELLGVQAESLQAQQNLYTEFGKEQTAEAQLIADNIIITQREVTNSYKAELQKQADAREQAEAKAKADRDKIFTDTVNGEALANAKRLRDLRKARNEGLVTEKEFANRNFCFRIAITRLTKPSRN
jgi:hypothetical protein